LGQRVARTELIATRASAEKKARFRALAKSRGMSESKLLDLLIETVLEQNPAPKQQGVVTEGETGRGGEGSDRVTIRLRPGDGELMQSLAEQRGMKRSTYLAALVRAHVRSNPPMPTNELAVVKRAVAELGAIGRNLNQIAHIANQSGEMPQALGLELRAVLNAVEDLRRHIAAIVKANLISWEADYA
jgi:hypothetical protein